MVKNYRESNHDENPNKTHLLFSRHCISYFIPIISLNFPTLQAIAYISRKPLFSLIQIHIFQKCLIRISSFLAKQTSCMKMLVSLQNTAQWFSLISLSTIPRNTVSHSVNCTGASCCSLPADSFLLWLSLSNYPWGWDGLIGSWWRFPLLPHSLLMFAACCSSQEAKQNLETSTPPSH